MIVEKGRVKDKEDKKWTAVVALLGLGFIGYVAYVFSKPSKYVAPPDKVKGALIFGVNDKSLTIGYPSVYTVEPFVNISTDFPNEHFPLYVKCTLSLNGDTKTLEKTFNSCSYWILGDATFDVYKSGTYTLKAEFYAKTSQGVEITDTKTYTKTIDIYKVETVNVNIRSQPVDVYIKGIYPEFDGSTPQMISVEKGKTFGFTAPKKSGNYVFSGVDNAQVMSTDDTVTIKGLADADKTVTLYYVVPTPSTPKWSWSSDVGQIKIYDAYIDTKNNTVNVDIEVVNYHDLNGAMFVGEYVYGSGWGVVLGSVGQGRNLVTLRWGNYESLAVNADLYSWHTYITVIDIKGSEIRRV